MREDTPPPVDDIGDDDVEEIFFDNDPSPDEEESEEEGSIDASSEDDRILFMGRPRSAVPDDAVLSFEKHDGAVFGCMLHPYLPLAVTGGEDDRAYIWNIHSGDQIHEFVDHKDTVTDVSFSFDGKYLATGDMAGEMFVHKVQEGDSDTSLTFRKVWEYSMGDMAWMRWHFASNILFAGSENGEVYVWRIPSGDCKILPGEGARCAAGVLTGDGKKLFTGYSNGKVKLWDLKNNTAILEVGEEHPMAQQCVLSVACCKESPLYVSGGEGGKLVFYSNNGPVNQLDADGTVEYIAFPPKSDQKIVATGTLHGQIAIWDYGKYSLRTECEHPEPEDGITRLNWLSDHTLLAATIHGSVFGFDARTGVRKFSLSGHVGVVYDIHYHPGIQILLTGSEDGTAKIFTLPQLGD